MDAILELQRRIEITQSVIHGAKSIAEYAKQLPKGKHHKNVFVKTYNRRPMNKGKRAKAIIGMAMSSAISAMQVAMHLSTPNRKYGPNQMPGVRSLI